MVMVAVDNDDDGLTIQDVSEEEAEVLNLINSKTEDELTEFEEQSVLGSAEYDDKRCELVSDMLDFKSNIDWYLDDKGMYSPIDCRQVATYASMIINAAEELYITMMHQAIKNNED